MFPQGPSCVVAVKRPSSIRKLLDPLQLDLYVFHYNRVVNESADQAKRKHGKATETDFNNQTRIALYYFKDCKVMRKSLGRNKSDT